MRCLLLFFVSTILLSLASCKKENNQPGLFYGYWKTSYGDTIAFVHENRDVLYYKISLNPALNTESANEFRYINDKLEVKGLAVGSAFSRLQSFKWNEPGKSFEVQGVEWFPFISSTTVYYTFTIIP